MYLALAFALTLAANPATGAEPQVLLDQYRCTVCHAQREALAGPAWVDVATRYRGTRQAEATVAARIRDGVQGGGPWHMPPHPEISPSDAATMARYILAPRN